MHLGTTLTILHPIHEDQICKGNGYLFLYLDDICPVYFRFGLKDQEEGDLGPAYGFQWRHLVLGTVMCTLTYRPRI